MVAESAFESGPSVKAYSGSLASVRTEQIWWLTLYSDRKGRAARTEPTTSRPSDCDVDNAIVSGPGTGEAVHGPPRATGFRWQKR